MEASLTLTREQIDGELRIKFLRQLELSSYDRKCLGEIFDMALRTEAAERERDEARNMLSTTALENTLHKLRKAETRVSVLEAALRPFAAMHREGSDPDARACSRGVASDMTVIYSGDFAKAAETLAAPDRRAEG